LNFLSLTELAQLAHWVGLALVGSALMAIGTILYKAVCDIDNERHKQTLWTIFWVGIVLGGILTAVGAIAIHELKAQGKVPRQVYFRDINGMHNRVEKTPNP